MAEAPLSRYRGAFHKTAAMRFTGNLDLHRTIERTLRRARLPLAYTRGFHPHPRITLASALALGCTSEAELVDFWLEEDVPAELVLERSSRASPPGIRFTGVARVPLASPALPAVLRSCEYEIELAEEDVPHELAARVDSLLGSEAIPRKRREKSYDLRPLIEGLRHSAVPGEGPRLWMRLASREGATGRPEEVLLALGIEPAGARIHRTRLQLAEALKD
jgi:radical SAM-linked protein